MSEVKNVLILFFIFFYNMFMSENIFTETEFKYFMIANITLKVGTFFLVLKNVVFHIYMKHFWNSYINFLSKYAT